MLHHSLIHFLMIQRLSNNLRQPPGFFFCLGVRFLFFLTFCCKKASFLACIFPKLFIFFNCLLFILFPSCQVPDLGLPFTPNLLRSMFSYHFDIAPWKLLKISYTQLQPDHHRYGYGHCSLFFLFVSDNFLNYD